MDIGIWYLWYLNWNDRRRIDVKVTFKKIRMDYITPQCYKDILLGGCNIDILLCSCILFYIIYRYIALQLYDEISLDIAYVLLSLISPCLRRLNRVKQCTSLSGRFVCGIVITIPGDSDTLIPFYALNIWV